MSTTNWRDRAACIEEDPELFAVDDLTMTWDKHDQISEAKTVCKRCPVKAECLQTALDGPEWGIWGGTTDRERGAMPKNKPVRKRADNLPKTSPTVRKTCGTYLGYKQHHDNGESPCPPCLVAKSDYMKERRRVEREAREERASA